MTVSGIAYFRLLTREQQCASVGKLIASRLTVDDVADLLGLLRDQVAAMADEHQAREHGANGTAR
jgi:hypothetical protein